MKTKSAKAKGRRLQDKVKDDLVKHLEIANPKEVKKAIMGEKGPDVVYKTLIAECTNTEYLRIWEKLAQLDHHLENSDQKNPLGILIFKKNKSEIYATIKWSDFLHMLVVIRGLLKGTIHSEIPELDPDRIITYGSKGGNC